MCAFQPEKASSGQVRFPRAGTVIIVIITNFIMIIMNLSSHKLQKLFVDNIWFL